MNNLIYEEFIIANTKFNIKKELSFLKSSIIESLYILELKDDWDSEGSVGYSKSTWRYSISFLLYLYEKILNDYKITLNAPLIFHGIDGGIDFLLEKDSRNKFLMRLNKECNEFSYYYEYNGIEMKGFHNIYEIQNVIIQNYLLLKRENLI